MSDLIRQIQMAQRDAGEAAVIANLQSQGLIPTESKPAKPDDGGPAYPGYGETGMTLRDYFAAKAMQGWITTCPNDMPVQDVSPTCIADFAYENGRCNAESEGGKMSANDTQISGNHYKGKPLQVWDFVAANNLGYFEGNIVKYVSRWKDKGGVDDLRKAKHYIEKLIELETQVKDEYKGERLILPKDDGPLWIQWDGGPCPVFRDTLVEVIVRDGEHFQAIADCVYWTDCGRGKDVIRYRVIK